MDTIDQREAAGNKHVVTTRLRYVPYHEVLADLIAANAPKDGRALDIGCGMGQIERLVLKRRPDVKVSILDAYQVCLDSCRELPNIQSAALVDEARFNIDEVVQGQYDIVFMCHVLEHLLDPVGGLRKAMSCVKDGGYCILAVPNPTRPEVFIGNLFRRHYVNRGHVVSWDPSHWRNFLERIMKYDVVRHLSDCVVLPGARRFAPLNALSKQLAKVVPWWGRSNISLIRKTAGVAPGAPGIEWDTVNR